jgi:hypothetical protein
LEISPSGNDNDYHVGEQETNLGERSHDARVVTIDEAKRPRAFIGCLIALQVMLPHILLSGLSSDHDLEPCHFQKPF